LKVTVPLKGFLGKGERCHKGAFTQQSTA